MLCLAFIFSLSPGVALGNDVPPVANPNQVLFNLNYEGAPGNGVFRTANILANGSIEGGIGPVTNANAPVREGYTFIGWFRNQEVRGEFNDVTGRVTSGQHNAIAGGAGTFTTQQASAGVTVFAHWIPNRHVVYITVEGPQEAVIGFSIFSDVKIINEGGTVLDVTALTDLSNPIVKSPFSWETRVSRDGTVTAVAGEITVNTPLFKDLNGNGQLDPYEDWRNTLEDRSVNLAGMMTAQEIAGLMLFSGHQNQWFPNAPNRNDPTNPLQAQTVFLANDDLRHVLIAGTGNFGTIHAGWNNNTQAMVESFGLGIPNNNSSDPRHSPAIGVEFYSDNLGTMSLWPTTLGLAATMCESTVLEFSKIASAEYRAFGISTALHPHIDIATDTRWSRYSGTFGEDPRLSSALARMYTMGWQGTFEGDFDDDMDGHYWCLGSSQCQRHDEALDRRNTYGRWT